MKISDYQWASVAHYIAHLEQILVLTEVSAESVYSFRVQGGRFDQLRKRKEKIVQTLEENNAKLCVYVAERKGRLESGELDVIRGIYKSNLEAVGIAREHAERLKKMLERYAEKLPGMGGDNGDLPF